MRKTNRNRESKSQNDEEKPPPLSEDLRAMLAVEHEHEMTIGDIESALKKRGFAIIIMLLAIPFIIPSIPGISVPFGIAIMLMGIRIVLGKKPWLPQKILQKKLSQKAFQNIIKTLLKTAVILEKIAKPRMHFLERWPVMKKLIGVGIASNGLFLALPLPIPFTNTLPAISILLLAAGMMEKDGLLVLLGYFSAVLAWAYLALFLLLGKVGIQHLWSHF